MQSEENDEWIYLVNPIYTGLVRADAGQDFEWIIPYQADPEVKSYTALLFPLTDRYVNNYRPEDLQIEISGQDEAGQEKTILYKVPDGKLQGMYSGRQLTVKLKSKNIDAAFANKKMWVYGVTAPVYRDEELQKCPIYMPEYPNPEDFPRNKWYYYDRLATDALSRLYPHILWQEGCGWYDCNKTYMTDGADDGSMCWAAASSNMLHWWAAHNRAYIEAYDRRFGSLPGFERPALEFHENQKSSIFKYFIGLFANRGSGTFEGIDWFISGRHSSNLPAFDSPEDYEKYRNFPGFFSEVFGRNSTIAYYSSNTSKENFNKIIKDALTHKKAIGYDVTYSPGDHAMNIWGAEFDENGDVSYVYVCNNNSGDQDPGPMCSREPVVYAKSSDPYIKGERAYIADPESGKPSVLITTLHTLDLGTEKWEAVLGKP